MKSLLAGLAFMAILCINMKAQTNKNDTLVYIDSFPGKSEYLPKEIFNAKGLVTNKTDLSIIEYEFSYRSDAGYEKSKKIKSNLLTDEFFDELKKMSVGTKIYFEKIVAKNKNGTLIKLKPFIIKIKRE